MTDIKWTEPLTLGAPVISAHPVPGLMGGNMPAWPGAAVTPVAGGFHVTAPSDASKGFAVDIPITAGLPEFLAHTDDRYARVHAVLEVAVGGPIFLSAGFSDATDGLIIPTPQASGTLGILAQDAPYPLTVGTHTLASTGMNVPAVKALLDAQASGAVVLRMQFSGGAASVIDITVKGLTVQMLDAAGPPPALPAAVRYRDPADGKFKPLSLLAVRGYPVPPQVAPDLSKAKIGWATHSAVKTYGTPEVATPPPVVYGTQSVSLPAAANVRVTPLADGRFRVQADPWTWTGNTTGGYVPGFTPRNVIYLKVPVTLDPAALEGATFIRGKWRLVNTAGGTPGVGAVIVGNYAVEVIGLSLPALGAAPLKFNAAVNFKFGAVGATTEDESLPYTQGASLAPSLAGAFVFIQMVPIIAATYPDGTHPATVQINALDVEWSLALEPQEVVAP